MFLISTGAIVALVILGVFLLLIIGLVGFFIRTLNELRRLEVKTDESFSGIDVALTKRFDTITKMVEVVKGYSKHEAETLEKTIRWRSGLPANATLEDKQAFSNNLDLVSRNINVVAEQYPQLKADSLFKDLSATILDVEEHLQASRRLYNANVSALNQRIVMFPSSLIAALAHIEKRKFFEAEEQKREDVKIQF